MFEFAGILFINWKVKNKQAVPEVYIIHFFIWLYWRLFCRLRCRLYWRQFCRMFCRLYCILFFVMQYFFFSFFHKCSKFMAMSDASRMFFCIIIFFSSSVIFYLTQNPRGYSFRIYKHTYFDSFKIPLTATNSSSLAHHFHHVSF